MRRSGETMTNRGRFCPTGEELEELFNDELSALNQNSILAHLSGCQPCSEKFSELANTWSLVDIAQDKSLSGTDSLAFEKMLKTKHPEVTASRPEIPLDPPNIDGYESLELLATGGMGLVYRGRDITFQRFVAIKLISARSNRTDAGYQRSLREAEILARLNHPFICTILDAGIWHGHPYLVMEWVEGPTLQDRIKQNPLSLIQATRIAHGIAEALSSVHAAGIVHRDLKPENVLLTAAADSQAAGIPKLIDFGLAHPDDDSPKLTVEGMILGTPCFMAAEQTGLDESLGPVTPATDIHGIGGLLFAMLTGNAPYKAPTLMASMQRSVCGNVAGLEKLAAVPNELKRIILTCLEPNPERRFASAADVSKALDAFLVNHLRKAPVDSHSNLTWQPSFHQRRWFRQPSIWIYSSLTVVAIALTIRSGFIGTGFLRPSKSNVVVGKEMVTKGTNVVLNSVPSSKAPAEDIDSVVFTGPSAGQSLTLHVETRKAEEVIFTRLNEMRQKAGLALLKIDERLSQGAQKHAETMARTGFLADLIGNETEFLQSRIAPTGYRCQCATQLITAGVEPESVVSRLLEETRYQGVLKEHNFGDVGIGAAVGGDGRRYYAILLAMPVP